MIRGNPKKGLEERSLDTLNADCFQTFLKKLKVVCKDPVLKMLFKFIIISGILTLFGIMNIMDIIAIISTVLVLIFISYRITFKEKQH